VEDAVVAAKTKINLKISQVVALMSKMDRQVMNHSGSNTSLNLDQIMR
jgi:hypothetical protein